MTPSLRWRLAQWLELRWWRRYLRYQSPADYLARKRAYWQRTLDELDWTVEEGATALDAGCGPAGIFTLLHNRQRMTALDPLLEHYEEKLAIFSRADYPEVTFICGPLEARLPSPGVASAPIPATSFPPATAPQAPPPYDVLYCFNAINHVSDWAGALAKLTAAARPGTRMILTSDVHRHQWLLPIFRALPGDALHPQQHGPEAYRSELARNGWKIEREVVLRTERIFNYTAWIATKR